MRVRLIRIGNSWAIRIPNVVLDEFGFRRELDLEVRSGKLVLSRKLQPREGWDGAFRAMTQRREDRLVDGDQLAASSWDEEEWEW